MFNLSQAFSGLRAVSPSRRFGAAILAAVLGTLGIPFSQAPAQNTPGSHQDNSGMNGSLSRGDLEKLSGDHKQDATADAAQDSPQARAKAREQSDKLIKILQIACEMSDAKLIISGTRRPASGGREVETRVYEVACGAGMGYLLETQGTEPPIGISCLNAEETRAADVAKGREPSFFCKLPANKDVHAMVASLIGAGGGGPCAIRELKPFGRSESTHSEYSEVTCEEGTGYLLRTALPGSQAKTQVTSCSDAAKQGIKCRMTDSGPVETPVTMDTFKSALAQRGVSCAIDQLRMIGQEDHLKRYVVEYRCAGQSTSLIAFIPLQGNANPFQSMDCKEAVEYTVSCEFGPVK
jgi:hypothetical protein